jgi:hypothetical protein
MSTTCVDWYFSEEEVEIILTREGNSMKKDFELRKTSIQFLQEVGTKLVL